jgi:tetratricopeptide (TPR) repeat protein
MIKPVLTLSLVTGLLSCSPVMAQSGWRMKEVPVKTRWATDVSPENVLQEYPRPQMARDNWINLNGLWEYAICIKDAPAPVSYEGTILVPFPLESALSGVQKSLLPNQDLWYRRHFKRPSLKAGEKLILHFGAVDWQATVYLNGKKVGMHKGGYTNFSFDITNALQENNELLVKVFDPTDQGPNPHGKQVLNPNSIWYTPSSGIWQTVWMEKVPPVSLAGLKITPDIDNKLVGIEVKVSAETPAADYEIEIVANNTIKVNGANRGATSTAFKIPVKAPHLWSPDDPYLYDLAVRLYIKGKLIDEVKSYFGMRKIEVRKDNKGIPRIFLNNKYTYNLGVLDQGFWPEGLYTAPTDKALLFDVQAIKAMGFNTVRKHIKTEPARWYYHCDKLGMLVWQDLVNPANTGAEGQRAFESESKEILEQLHNYPSIVTWVVFNEGWGTYDQERITRMVKDADPSRIVNGHTGENYYQGSPEEIGRKWPASDMTDIHAYPDPQNPPALEGKALALGEFGGIGVSIEGRLWDDIAGWGYEKITPASLVNRYAGMVDSLKRLEALGLSASIYTEPFDVEGEQNGLMTYDRSVLKIPLAKLRAIHSSLWPVTANYEKASKAFTVQDADTANPDLQYEARLAEYTGGRKDSIFLRRLSLMALRLRDSSNATRISDDFIVGRKDIFTPGNLKFVNQFVINSRSKAFSLFFKHPAKVDEILGKDIAEDKVMDVISAEEIMWQAFSEEAKPDWEAIEKVAVSKYGALGEEKVWGMRMVYYRQKKLWEPYGQAYRLYFQKYGFRFHGNSNINDFAWDVFEHVTDTAAIAEAAKWLKKVVAEDPWDAASADTYANLLYKLGNTSDAIVWQEKALKLDPQNSAIKENLDKMRNGKRTW